jgi:hypothetical protein
VTRLREERGQTLVLTAVFLTVMLGMAAMVLDVGHWYHAKRELQAIADASALAAAQALPNSTPTATSDARAYAVTNGGPVPTVTFSTKTLTNDTVRVRVTRDEPGFFSKVFSINSVNVGAVASARVGTLGVARYAAPFGVDERHPKLSCKPPPCSGETTLDLEKIGPGGFRILNIDGSGGGTGQSILADWILHGYDGDMPTGNYLSDPGAKFNSSEVIDAMSQMLGKELLFPVYKTTNGQGAGMSYKVIGWAGFVVTGFSGDGDAGLIQGHFSQFIAHGLTGQKGVSGFGAYVVTLTE